MFRCWQVGGTWCFHDFPSSPPRRSGFQSKHLHTNKFILIKLAATGGDERELCSQYREMYKNRFQEYPGEYLPPKKTMVLKGGFHFYSFLFFVNLAFWSFLFFMTRHPGNGTRCGLHPFGQLVLPIVSTCMASLKGHRERQIN